MKPFVDALDQIPEALRTEYEPTGDGRFRLKLDGPPAGYIPIAKHTETVNRLRENGVATLRALGVEPGDNEWTTAAERAAALRTQISQLQGIDPAEYQRLKAESDEIKTKTGGKGAQAYTELKAQLDSLAGMVKQANDQLLAERQARANAERANAERTLQETIGRRFLAARGRGNCVDYLTHEARSIFEVRDGQVVPQPTAINPETGSAWDLDLWMKAQMRERAFLFEPSSGGGAPAPAAARGSGARMQDGQIVIEGQGDPEYLGTGLEYDTKQKRMVDKKTGLPVVFR